MVPGPLAITSKVAVCPRGVLALAGCSTIVSGPLGTGLCPAPHPHNAHPKPSRSARESNSSVAREQRPCLVRCDSTIMKNLPVKVEFPFHPEFTRRTPISAGFRILSGRQEERGLRRNSSDPDASPCSNCENQRLC